MASKATDSPLLHKFVSSPFKTIGAGGYRCFLWQLVPTMLCIRGFHGEESFKGGVCAFWYLESTAEVVVVYLFDGLEVNDTLKLGLLFVCNEKEAEGQIRKLRAAGEIQTEDRHEFFRHITLTPSH